MSSLMGHAGVESIKQDLADAYWATACGRRSARGSVRRSRRDPDVVSFNVTAAGQLKLTRAATNPGGSPFNDAEVLFKEPEPPHTSANERIETLAK
jgi:hypothetical protein